MKLLEALVNGLFRGLGLAFLSALNSWLSTLDINEMTTPQNAATMIVILISLVLLGYRFELK